MKEVGNYTEKTPKNNEKNKLKGMGAGADGVYLGLYL